MKIRIKTVLMVVCLAINLAVKIDAQILVTNVANINNGGSAGCVAMSDNFVYLANGTDGLRIYDVLNPTNPINVGHAPTFTNGDAVCVTVASNYAYLATVSDGLRIYDVSTPTNPINVGFIPARGWNDGSGFNVGPEAFYGVTVMGNYAYLAAGNFGLRVFDISNPSNPINVYNFTNNYNDGFNSPVSSEVVVSGNYAYLVNGQDGLRIFDISNPLSPTNIADVSTFTDFVAVSGNYAYMRGFNQYGMGLGIYDISNPTNVILVRGITNLYPNNVTISGNYAYVADGQYGLVVYDISNPTNPIQVGNDAVGSDPDPIDFIWAVFSIAVSGNYAYAANDFGFGIEKLIPRTSINLALVISWPATSTNYVLQQNADLTTTNWVNVTNALFFTSGQGRFIASPGIGTMFYRLIAN